MSHKPSIGRIVHYAHPDTGTCVAAVVTLADHPQVSEAAVLTLFEPFLPPRPLPTLVVHDEARPRGTWHWPERAPQGAPLPAEYSTEGLNPPPDVISATGLGLIQRGDRTPGPDVP